jgi:hypothetical protein
MVPDRLWYRTDYVVSSCRLACTGPHEGHPGQLAYTMDEGTIKTPIPIRRLYWSLCFGWCSNFVGSEFGQKQSVKLLQNMVYNTPQHPPPPPTVTHCLWEGGEGWGRSERR